LAEISQFSQPSPDVEKILAVYYDRLKQLDEVIYRLTTFFFGINTALLGVVWQFAQNDALRLVISWLGYGVSWAQFTTTFKGFLSWELYEQDLNTLEEQAGYNIAKKFRERKQGNVAAQFLSMANTRIRFNFMFVAIWAALIPYFAVSPTIISLIGNGWPIAVVALCIALWLSMPSFFVGPPWRRIVWSVYGAMWRQIWSYKGGSTHEGQ